MQWIDGNWNWNANAAYVAVFEGNGLSIYPRMNPLFVGWTLRRDGRTYTINPVT